MVQFSGLASLPYFIQVRIARKRAGFPHSDISGYNACLSAPPSFSQTTTSFIASNCLGIHHMRLFAWSYTWTHSLRCAKNSVQRRTLSAPSLPSSKYMFYRILRLKFSNSEYFTQYLPNCFDIHHVDTLIIYYKCANNFYIRSPWLRLRSTWMT